MCAALQRGSATVLRPHLVPSTAGGTGVCVSNALRLGLWALGKLGFPFGCQASPQEQNALRKATGAGGPSSFDLILCRHSWGMKPTSQQPGPHPCPQGNRPTSRHLAPRGLSLPLAPPAPTSTGTAPSPQRDCPEAVGGHVAVPCRQPSALKQPGAEGRRQIGTPAPVPLAGQLGSMTRTIPHSARRG